MENFMRIQIWLIWAGFSGNKMTRLVRSTSVRESGLKITYFGIMFIYYPLHYAFFFDLNGDFAQKLVDLLINYTGYF